MEYFVFALLGGIIISFRSQKDFWKPGTVSDMVELGEYLMCWFASEDMVCEKAVDWISKGVKCEKGWKRQWHMPLYPSGSSMGKVSALEG